MPKTPSFRYVQSLIQQVPELEHPPTLTWTSEDKPASSLRQRKGDSFYILGIISLNTAENTAGSGTMTVTMALGVVSAHSEQLYSTDISDLRSSVAQTALPTSSMDMATLFWS